jgi:hypothetical protein
VNGVIFKKNRVGFCCVQSDINAESTLRLQAACRWQQRFFLFLALVLVNNQLDALFSMYLFISLLYVFRATQCSSSGESNCINTSSGMYHSVQVTAWYAGQSLPAYQAVTYTE